MSRARETARAAIDATEPRPASGSPSNEDIARYLPVVHQVVRRLLRRLPSNVRREDLVAAGLYGLYDSMRKNGGDTGPKFEWYARIRIRGAILDELRSQDWLPRRARWVASGKMAGSRAASGSGPAPSAVVGFDDLSSSELATHLADPDAGDSELQMEKMSECRALVQAVDRLPERERTIVRLHYFEGVRFKDIGQLLGVSEPRISQLHSRALGRLRTQLGAAALAA
ncbi:MAG: sigma-70 family RNA polymerase sigma factor [Deltaproteobacteria bacterium]|nr:sigma-70 family RNA polymerase sigma factor [Deltaproteobacteria bacterium]